MNHESNNEMLNNLYPEVTPEPTPVVVAEQKPEPTVAELFKLVADLMVIIGKEVTKPQNLDELIEEQVTKHMDSFLHSDALEELIDERLEFGAEGQIEEYLNRNFDIDDYVDIDARIEDKVSDEIKEVEERLKETIEEVIGNATLTINI